jgi:Flp pilus assembly secretin CpaC
MEPQSIGAHNKKSAIAILVLMLSLATLQSPLWRTSSAPASLAVRAGGAALVSSQTPIAQVSVEQNAQATAEVVGDHEVLIRGKALGETQLRIVSRDGRATAYRIVVQSESAQAPAGSLAVAK